MVNIKLLAINRPHSQCTGQAKRRWTKPGIALLLAAYDTFCAYEGTGPYRSLYFTVTERACPCHNHNWSDQRQKYQRTTVMKVNNEAEARVFSIIIAFTIHIYHFWNYRWQCFAETRTEGNQKVLAWRFQSGVSASYKVIYWCCEDHAVFVTIMTILCCRLMLCCPVVAVAVVGRKPFSTEFSKHSVTVLMCPLTIVVIGCKPMSYAYSNFKNELLDE